jgi:hypothetical protein
VNDKHEAIIDEWLNNFCNDIGIQNVCCFFYKKDDQKMMDKVKQSHQFQN